MIKSVKISRAKSGRRDPYTEDEIKKCNCFRCGAPAKFQWQICSDKNLYRPICEECDIELNYLVLLFMKFGDAEGKIIDYMKRVKGHKNPDFNKVHASLMKAINNGFYD